MTLILRKSGKVGERTRWNLSFSGVSLSHKRGWMTLNSRGRSVIDLPGPLFTFRVGKTGTAIWFILFLLFDLLLLIAKILILPFVLVIDGFHELFVKKASSNTGLGVFFLTAGLLALCGYVWVIMHFYG